MFVEAYLRRKTTDMELALLCKKLCTNTCIFSGLLSVLCSLFVEDTSRATSATPGRQQLENNSLLIPKVPFWMPLWEYKHTNTPWVQRHSKPTHTKTPHLLVLAGNLETLQKPQDPHWMVFRKDTSSTQDKLLRTKAIIKGLELTPGNGIIPFCASQGCFSHMERQTAVLLAASQHQFLVSAEVRSTASKPVLCM